MSHRRGEFLKEFFLPKLISICLHILSKSNGPRAHSTFKIIFKYFGYFELGHDGVS